MSRTYSQAPTKVEWSQEPGYLPSIIKCQDSCCAKRKRKKKKKKKAVATETFPCTERTSKARKVRAVMFIKIVPTLNRDLPQALFTPESQELPSP